MKVHISPKSKKIIRVGINTITSLGAILWIIFALDWADVQKALVQAHYGWVVIGMLAVMLNAAIRALRWRVLLRPTSARFSPLFLALIIGQGANYVLPARMGDVIRIYIIGRELNISRARALGTVALEKLWDIVMLVVFTLALSLFVPLPDWLLIPVRGVAIAISAGLLVIAILFWRQHSILRLLEKFLRRWLPKFQQRFVQLTQNVLTGFSGMQSVTRVTEISVLSVVIWLLGGATNYLIFLAFGIPLSYSVALILLLALIVGVAVPSLPGRVGVFEAICIFVLTTFHISENLAFSYALVMHITAMLPPLLTAIILNSRYNLKLASSYES